MTGLHLTTGWTIKCRLYRCNKCIQKI